MSFHSLKNWGLTCLVLILVTFAIMTTVESRLYKNSIANMEEVYHPLFHRIIILDRYLKTTEINFEIYWRSEKSTLSTSGEMIQRLTDKINELDQTPQAWHLPILNAAKRKSRTTNVAWKKFAALWTENPDFASDDIQQWAELLAVALEELKWMVIGYRDLVTSDEVNRSIEDVLALIRSTSDEIYSFMSQEPIFIDDAITPLSNIIERLSDVDDGELLRSLEPSEDNISAASGHSHTHDRSGMDPKHSSDTTLTKNQSITDINDATIAKARTLRSVLRSIELTEDTTSATYLESIEVARKLIREIESHFELFESRLMSSSDAKNAELYKKLNQFQIFRHLITLVGLLLAFLVAFYMSYRMNKHVAIVTDGTRLLAEGKLDHRIPETKNDQLGEIAKAFNRMAVKLRAREHERDALMEAVDRSAKDASKASAAKGEFMAAMSHEIRTPINGVLGTVELLMREPLTKSQRHLTETIHRSGNALMGIINDILDYSKIEAGGMELESAPFDLRELIEDVCEMAAPSAHNKDLEINYKIDLDASQLLIGDSLRIRQILTNLISNAIKFTETGNIDIIVCSETRSQQLAFVTVHVRDTGIGLSKEAQTRIFHAFSQASSSTTRKYGGTGLGLSISRQLTEMMNGTLSVVSDEGAGSVFTLSLELPISDNRVEQKHVITQGYELNGLLLSNHQITREALTSQLDQLGVSVQSLDSGKRAMHYLNDTDAELKPKYDFMIVDKRLNDMSGLEFLQSVQKNNNQHRLCKRAILCMVDEPDYVLREIKKLSVEYTLTKPVRQSALYNCLMEFCGVSAADKQKDVDNAVQQKQYDANVLLVEDHPTNQDIISRMLTIMGCKVTLAENGQEALELLQQRQFDMTLMDCDMPVMDGLTATERLRDFERQNNISSGQSIVALTANALQGDRERCLRAGMNDYATKPLTMDSLARVLDEWVAGDQQSETHLKSSDNMDSLNESRSDSPKTVKLIPEELLDMDMVDQLLGMDDSDSTAFLSELVENFQSNWVQDSARLFDALETSDAEDIRKRAHRLKSASATIGAAQLTQLAASIELSAREENIKVCRVEASKLPDCFNATIDAFACLTRKAA